MKQHEALGLAIESELKTNTKMVLITIIYKSDFSTWAAKPMSVSYLRSALNGTLSTPSIERAYRELRKLGIIERIDTGRADKVKSTRINITQLRGLKRTHQTEGIHQTDGLNPSHRGVEPITQMDNNNLYNNQSNNLYTQVEADQEPSQEATHQTEGMNSEPNEWGYRDRVKAARESGDWSTFWGTSSSNDEPEPEPEPQPQPQPMRYEERARRAKELMHRSYK